MWYLSNFFYISFNNFRQIQIKTIFYRRLNFLIWCTSSISSSRTIWPSCRTCGSRLRTLRPTPGLRPNCSFRQFASYKSLCGSWNGVVVSLKINSLQFYWNLNFGFSQLIRFILAFLKASRSRSMHTLSLSILHYLEQCQVTCSSPQFVFRAKIHMYVWCRFSNDLILTWSYPYLI